MYIFSSTSSGQIPGRSWGLLLSAPGTQPALLLRFCCLLQARHSSWLCLFSTTLGSFHLIGGWNQTSPGKKLQNVPSHLFLRGQESMVPITFACLGHWPCSTSPEQKPLRPIKGVNILLNKYNMSTMQNSNTKNICRAIVFTWLIVGKILKITNL